MAYFSCASVAAVYSIAGLPTGEASRQRVNPRRSAGAQRREEAHWPGDAHREREPHICQHPGLPHRHVSVTPSLYARRGLVTLLKSWMVFHVGSTETRVFPSIASISAWLDQLVRASVPSCHVVSTWHSRVMPMITSARYGTRALLKIKS